MSIFTKIIAGEIPSFKVFEDEFTFAFLDIHPLTLGHTLLVPKEKVADYRDLKDPYFTAVWKNSQILGNAIHKATKCIRVGLFVEGMGVKDHFHLHLIPIFDEKSMDINNAHTESDENMAKIQKAIVQNL